jgi:hypothetical protein
MYEASKYNYCISIKKRDGPGYAKVCLPTKSYFVDLETLFRNRDCVVFSYELWNGCRPKYSKNVVSLEVEIQWA